MSYVKYTLPELDKYNNLNLQKVKLAFIGLLDDKIWVNKQIQILAYF